MMRNCLFAVALAQVTASDDNDVDFESVDRSIQLDVGSDQFEVQAEQEGAAEGFSTSYDARGRTNPDGDELLEFRFSFEQESSDLETEVDFRVTFTGLIEFEEVDQVSGYTPGDTLVQTYDNSGTSWNAWTTVQDCASFETDCYFELQADTTDNVLETIVYFTSTAATVSDGVALNANTVKFDLNINNFPFQSTTSYLAVVGELRLEVESEVESMEENDDGEEEYVVNSGSDIQGFFAWATTANSGAVPVITTSDSSSTYFTFDVVAPTSISWDPEIGVSSAMSIVTSPAVTLALFAALLL